MGSLASAASNFIGPNAMALERRQRGAAVARTWRIGRAGTNERGLRHRDGAGSRDGSRLCSTARGSSLPRSTRPRLKDIGWAAGAAARSSMATTTTTATSMRPIMCCGASTGPECHVGRTIRRRARERGRLHGLAEHSSATRPAAAAERFDLGGDVPEPPAALMVLLGGGLLAAIVTRRA